MLFISILIMIVFSSLGKNEIFRNKLINRLGLIIILYVMLIHLNINSIEKISTGINIYNSLLLINNLNNVIILLVLLISLIYVMFISFNITSISKIDNINYSRNGLIILILFNIMGLTLLPLVNDIMILFIIIELQSYSLYLITSVFNESNNAIKSGLYYFIVGSIASFIILDATVSIYDDIGLTNIQYILLYINKINTYDLLALIIGLFIKIGLFPFYNYSISIYTLSPTIITNYISLMPKLSILTLILILINYINIVNNYDINIIINFFIVSSMIIGSIGGLNSIKIKTLLAYSSLLNVSYMLLAIISNNNESIVAYLFYIIQYSLTHMNIFAILLIVSIYSSILLNNNNNDNNNNNKLNIIMTSQYSPIEYISQLKDLFINNIYLGLAFIISIYSLIGLPPLAGFYAKLLILVSTLNNGYIFLSLMLIIASSISTLYYANIIKIISFDTLQNFKNKSISNTWYTYNLFNKDLLNIDILYNTITNKIYYSNKNNKNNGEVSNIISYIVSSLTLIIMLVIIQYDTIIRGTYLVILYNSWI